MAEDALGCRDPVGNVQYRSSNGGTKSHLVPGDCHAPIGARNDMLFGRFVVGCGHPTVFLFIADDASQVLHCAKGIEVCFAVLTFVAQQVAFLCVLDHNAPHGIFQNGIVRNNALLRHTSAGKEGNIRIVPLENILRIRTHIAKGLPGQLTSGADGSNAHGSSLQGRFGTVGDNKNVLKFR